eukprot:RCo027548
MDKPQEQPTERVEGTAEQSAPKEAVAEVVSPPAGEEIDLSDGKGLLIKTVTTAGTGDDCPPIGAEVTMHFLAKMEDGTELENSKDEGKPISFTLGGRGLFKGLTEVVRTMKKGEKAMAKCSPEYVGNSPGSGGPGSQPSIPSHTTAIYELELLDWTDWGDVSKNFKQDGTVMKRIVTEGVGYDRPEFDDVAIFSYKMTLTGFPDKVLEQKDHFSVTIGAEEILSGLETALESMKKEEHSVCRLVPSVAFGPEGNPTLGVPPDASVEFEVTLHDIQRAPKAWILHGEEALAYAEKVKAEGTELFRQGKLQRAKRKYRAALDFVDSDAQLTPQQIAAKKPLWLTLALNLAACDLSVGDWNGVLVHTEVALELNPG